MSIRNAWRLAIPFVLLFPIAASAQWAVTGSTIASDCGTSPCTVKINPDTTTNSGTALEAGGDVIARGASTDVAADSTSGPAALWANAPSSQPSVVLLRSGSAEAVHLRREATSNDFTLYTGSAERLRVLASNGFLGLGMTSPLFRLDVSGGTRATSFTAGTSTNAPSGYPFYASSDAAGVSAAVQLRSNYAAYSTSFIGNVGTYGTYISHNREIQVGGFVDAAASPNQSNAAYAVVGDTQRTRIFQVGNFLMSGSTPVEMPRMVVKYNGNVGIGSTPAALDPAERLFVEGNLHVTGSINAKYQDVAEWVPSNDDLAPGTVVVLDPAVGNGVMASGAAYDTAVAGVVSAQPGLILGEGGAGKEQIATTGRVRVRVDATAAPIRVGDLLVTSDLPGVAMKSEPMEIKGRRFHQPGTIIGKALESLDGGQGEILVLLSLQ